MRCRWRTTAPARKGHGGAEAAARAVARELPANTFAMRIDVHSFYDSIDQGLLLDGLAVPETGIC